MRRRIVATAFVTIGIVLAGGLVAWAFFSTTSTASQIVHFEHAYPTQRASAAAASSTSITVTVLSGPSSPSPAASGYNVYAHGTTSPVLCAISGPTGGCTVNGLTASTNYSFDIYSTLSNWVSATSSTVSATTDAAPTITVNTLAASVYSTTTATLSGSVNPHGDTDAVGFCYGTSRTAVANCGSGTTSATASALSVGGTSTTAETANVNGLTAGTTYYYNLVAKSSGGTSYYGTPANFTTYAAPTVTTSTASHSTTTATVNGTVNTKSDTDSMYFCVSSTSSNVTTSSCGVSLTAASPASIDNTSQAETLSLTGLTAGTEYYYNLVAVSSGGTSYYGTPANFTTYAAPTVTTSTASHSTTTATVNGTVNTKSDTDSMYFCVSSTSSNVTTSSCGVSLTAASPASIDNTSQAETLSLTGLTAGTEYYYNLVAVSSGGTSYYGTPANFTTYAAPTIVTNAATSVSTTTATVNGTVNTNSDTDTVQYCYGTSTQVTTTSCTGTLDAANTSPLTSSTATSDGDGLTGLTAGTKYYYDLVVTSSGGTVYYGGTVDSFTTYAAPTIVTNAATSVSTTTATVNGTVNTNSDTDSMYFCYSTTSSNVTTSSCGGTLTAASPASIDSTSQAETLNLTGLTPNKEYYYNLVAKSSGGTSYYGTPANFTTYAAPTVTTSTASHSTTTATVNGTVNTKSDTDSMYFCVSSTSSNVTTSSCGVSLTAASPASIDNTSQAETLSLTGLTAGTEYYYNLVAVSSGGTSYYGTPANFTTYAAPTIVTNAATSVSTTTATVNGTVNTNSDTDTVQYCYGTSTQVTTTSCTGTLDAANTSPLTSSTATSDGDGLTGLTAGTKYYYDLVVTSSGGTVYYGGTVDSFTTYAAPTIVTNAATSVSTTTATVNGTVNTNSDTDTVQYCYGTSTQVTTTSCTGTLDAANTSPLTSSTATSDGDGLTGLTAGTKYYYDLVVTSSGGTVYYGGTVDSFTTYAAPTIVTNAATSVSTTTATVNGTVNTNSDTDSMYFCYSTTSSNVTTSSCGGTLTAASPASIDSTSQAETLNLTGLTPNKEYYYNLVAKSSGGTSYYGTPANFTTYNAMNFASAGTYGLSVPASSTATLISFTMDGAGGGSGEQGSSGGAGGAGGTATGTISVPSSASATTFTVVVGGGGAGGGSGFTAGGAGGTGGIGCAAVVRAEAVVRPPEAAGAVLPAFTSKAPQPTRSLRLAAAEAAVGMATPAPTPTAA